AEADLIVSTAHRAKGREFSAVRLHGDFIDIGDITKRASVRKGNDPITVSAEELHLIYVAVTRSKKRLSMPAYLVLDNSVVQKFKEQVALGHIKLV
ncbi:MAG: hypothetical protein LBP38_04620, partial [Desulfovibrio sp.]|nr:hypothetical protein [Desulfovibrio sp.]